MTSLSNLPEHLVREEIFTCLPVKDLMVLTRVCKSWLALNLFSLFCGMPSLLLSTKPRYSLHQLPSLSLLQEKARLRELLNQNPVHPSMGFLVDLLFLCNSDHLLSSVDVEFRCMVLCFLLMWNSDIYHVPYNSSDTYCLVYNLII